MRRLIVVLLLILAVQVYAQDWGLTETARSAGMANAFTATGEGADALVFNPAGLVVSPRHSILLTYSKDYAGLESGSIYQASLLYSPRTTGKMNFGFGLNMFNEDVYQMMSGSVAFGGRVFKVGGRDGFFSLFGIGNLYRVSYNEGNFYYVPEDGDDPDDPLFNSGTDKMAFGGDVAFLLRYKDFNLGGRVSNLNEPNPSISGDEAGKFPRKVRAGVSYTFFDAVTPSFDYEMPLSSDVGIQDEAAWYAGIEGWMLRDMIGLRAGYNEGAMTAGVSFRKLAGFGAGIDYAFIYPRVKSGAGLTTHKVSVGLGTKVPPPKRFDLVVDSDSITTMPAILASDSRGEIIATIANHEKDRTKGFKATAYYQDSLGESYLIETVNVDGIDGNDSRSVNFAWKTPASGFYSVYVSADDDGTRLPKLVGAIEEVDEENNTGSIEIASFYKPKIGSVQAAKTHLSISQVRFVKEEMPILPEVYFIQDNSEVDNRFDRLLSTIAGRLADNPDVTITLYGYFDKYTEPDQGKLAVERARMVQERLVFFGAPKDRIKIADKDYDPSETNAGKKDKKPSKSYLEPVAQENRRVEFAAEITGKKPLLDECEVVCTSKDISTSDFNSFKTSAASAKEVLQRNPDVELMLHSYSSENSRVAFTRVKELESMVEEQLGYFLKDRVFAGFTPRDGEVDNLELVYSAEPLLYKPITQANTPEGFKIAETQGNLISLDGLFFDAPIDTFYLVVRDNDDNIFRVLAHGKNNVPQEVNWDWRSDDGEPPNPMREYKVQFYMKDIMGREIEGESEKLTIDSDKMVHREELVLINFNFAGTTAKSEYIESRVENVAREILKRAEEPIKKMHVEIGGHTDVIGMYNANMELSQERAETELGHLKSFLIKYLDLSDDAALDKWLADRNISLSAKGYGPQIPYEINVWEKGYYKTLKLGNNDTPEGRILNRRVSAKIDVEM